MVGCWTKIEKGNKDTFPKYEGSYICVVEKWLHGIYKITQYEILYYKPSMFEKADGKVIAWSEIPKYEKGTINEKDS